MNVNKIVIVGFVMKLCGLEKEGMDWLLILLDFIVLTFFILLKFQILLNTVAGISF